MDNDSSSSYYSNAPRRERPTAAATQERRSLARRRADARGLRKAKRQQLLERRRHKQYTAQDIAQAQQATTLQNPALAHHISNLFKNWQARPIRHLQSVAKVCTTDAEYWEWPNPNSSGCYTNLAHAFMDCAAHVLSIPHLGRQEMLLLQQQQQQQPSSAPRESYTNSPEQLLLALIKVWYSALTSSTTTTNASVAMDVNDGNNDDENDNDEKDNYYGPASATATAAANNSPSSSHNAPTRWAALWRADPRAPQVAAGWVRVLLLGATDEDLAEWSIQMAAILIHLLQDEHSWVDFFVPTALQIEQAQNALPHRPPPPRNTANPTDSMDHIVEVQCPPCPWSIFIQRGPHVSATLCATILRMDRVTPAQRYLEATRIAIAATNTIATPNTPHTPPPVHVHQLWAEWIAAEPTAGSIIVAQLLQREEAVVPQLLPDGTLVQALGNVLTAWHTNQSTANAPTNAPNNNNNSNSDSNNPTDDLDTAVVEGVLPALTQIAVADNGSFVGPLLQEPGLLDHLRRLLQYCTSTASLSSTVSRQQSWASALGALCSALLCDAGWPEHASTTIGIPALVPTLVQCLLQAQEHYNSVWSRELLRVLFVAWSVPPSPSSGSGEERSIPWQTVDAMNGILTQLAGQHLLHPGVVAACVRWTKDPDGDVVTACVGLLDRLLRGNNQQSQILHWFREADGVAALEDLLERRHAAAASRATEWAADLLDDFGDDDDDDDDDSVLEDTLLDAGRTATGQFAFGLSPSAGSAVAAATPAGGRGRGRVIPAWMEHGQQQQQKHQNSMQS